MSAEDPARLLTVRDLVQRLSVSRSWVYEAAADGRLPSIRLGVEGPLRFVEEDVERWLDEARRAWKPGDTSRATLRRGAGAVER